MEAASDFAQLELRFVDQIQWRYELIRPLVLFENRPATQRAQETHTHPETVRKLRRRFQQQGMLGLLLDDVEVVPKAPTPRVSAAVVEEIDRLKALYAGFHARELARIVFYKLGERIGHKTAQRLWQQSPVVTQEALPLGDYHTQPDRYQARLQVIKLYAQGWEKISISRFLHVSRPTVDAWIKRFATEHFAGLQDKSRAPKAPARKVWLPLMIEVYHLQKRHPDAGKFRIWSLLAHPEISVRTVARIMALNKEVYDDIPHVRKRGPKLPTAAPPLQSLAAPPVLVHRWPHDGFRLGRGPVVESRDAGRVLTHHLGGSHGPLRSHVGRVAGALYGVSALWGPRDPDLG